MVDLEVQINKNRGTEWSASKEKCVLVVYK
jgi:hypothetical protein